MKKIALMIMMAGALSACGSLNKIDKQGDIVNQDVKWPKIEKNTYRVSGSQQGLWAADATLDQVQPGMNKSQLFSLLGRPHFGEGFIGVKEWNYNIMRPIDASLPKGPDNAKVCQLKTTFDKHMNVKQVMWNPVDCMVEVPKETPKIPTKQEQPKLERLSLSADFLFDFDKATLRPEASEALDQIVGKIKQRNTDFNEISVIGHTDRLGSDDYNRKLSERRALTVSTYLINAGVPAHRIQAFGAGETEPVKECEGTKPTPQLKACLQPNRRVEFAIY